jgi:hypothetical protein
VYFPALYLICFKYSSIALFVESFESNADPCKGRSVEIISVGAEFATGEPVTNTVAATAVAAITPITRLNLTIKLGLPFA